MTDERVNPDVEFIAEGFGFWRKLNDGISMTLLCIGVEAQPTAAICDEHKGHKGIKELIRDGWLSRNLFFISRTARDQIIADLLEIGEVVETAANTRGLRYFLKTLAPSGE